MTLRLEQVKQSAHTSIDAMAETVRLNYITGGVGQAAIYFEKGEEAADYVAAGYPTNLSSFPFIQAEVAATGKQAQQVADDILTQKANWIAKGAEIEYHRLLGKTSITAATTVKEVELIWRNTIRSLKSL